MASEGGMYKKDDMFGCLFWLAALACATLCQATLLHGRYVATDLAWCLVSGGFIPLRPRYFSILHALEPIRSLKYMEYIACLHEIS